MLPILFTLSEESTYVNQHNFGKGLTIISETLFYNSCSSRMLFYTLQPVMPQAGIKLIFFVLIINNNTEKPLIHQYLLHSWSVHTS